MMLIAYFLIIICWICWEIMMITWDEDWTYLGRLESMSQILGRLLESVGRPKFNHQLWVYTTNCGCLPPKGLVFFQIGIINICTRASAYHGSKLAMMLNYTWIYLVEMLWLMIQMRSRNLQAQRVAAHPMYKNNVLITQMTIRISQSMQIPSVSISGI